MSKHEHHHIAHAQTPAKAPVKSSSAAGSKAGPQMYIASATGRGGGRSTAARSRSKPSGTSTWPTARRGRRPLREGQIWAFFATKERAEKFTAARQTEGYDAIVVAATAKEATRWRSESV